MDDRWRRAPEPPPYVLDALQSANRREIVRKALVPYRDWSSVVLGAAYTLQGGFWWPSTSTGEYAIYLPVIQK